MFKLPNTACPTSGKKCQLKVLFSHNKITGTDKILQFCQLGEKMDCIDKRVQRMEAALEQGHLSTTDTPASSQGSAGQVTGYSNHSDEITAQMWSPH